MPNWKKLIVSGSDAALNSLNVTSALTASGLIYPTTDGSGGQVLVTDGSGNLSFDIPDAEKLTFEVQNGETFTLAKGTPIHVSSATNGTSIVIAASASDASTMPAHGILNQQLTAGSDGAATITGNINGIDTSAFSVGDTIFVGASGGYTNVKPQGSGNLIQNLGVVRKVDASNGTGEIFGSGRSNDVPNLPVDKIWVGTPTYTAASSFVDLLEPSSSITIGGSHTLTNSNRSSIIGGSSNCILNSSCNTITAGQSNKIVGSSIRSNVLGGRINCISGSISSIINGESNTIRDAGCSAILAGCKQSICCVAWSFIGAGICNEITRSAYGEGGLNAIVTGQENLIRGGGANFAYSTFIGAGRQNTGSYCFSSIVNGCKNSVNANLAFIGGGAENCINVNAISSSIIGGFNNTTNYCNTHIIGSGLTADKENYTFVNNLDAEGTISASIFSGSFVGDGSGLTGITTDGDWKDNSTYLSSSKEIRVTGTISGSTKLTIGSDHTNSGNGSSVAGGACNTVLGTCGFIGGGRCNYVGTNASTAPHVIGGGNQNCVIAYNTSGIFGGNQNKIDPEYFNGNIFIVGGIQNQITSSIDNGCIAAAFIGGGANNKICSCGNNSAILGGCQNTISKHCSVIGGGKANCANGTLSGILGGTTNTVSHDCSFIIGSNLTSDKGCYTFMNNLDVEGTVSASIFSGSFVGDGSGLTGITTDGDWYDGTTYLSSSKEIRVTGTISGSTKLQIGSGHTNSGTLSSIVGGQLNYITSAYSFIGGGCRNLTQAIGSVIVGGYCNTGSGACGFIGGGCKNDICSGETFSAIVGGRSNTVDGDYSFIGGGYLNQNIHQCSAVVGGYANCVCSCQSFIGGGFSNLINVSGDGRSTIGGGYNSGISGTCGYHTIAGGTTNCINANGNKNTVGGGGGNCILCNIENSTIAGGAANTICRTSGFDYGSFIGGGAGNCLVTATCWSFIGGGRYNCSTSNRTVIGGGTLNTASAAYSFIGGGLCNYNNSDCAVIVGGQSNINDVDSFAAFMGAGCCNIITNDSLSAIIVGGDKNIIDTSEYGVIVGGCCNKVVDYNHGTIVGGILNTASAACSFIGGGCLNYSTSPLSLIGGGCGNQIQCCGTSGATGQADCSVIAGGNCNIIAGGGYGTIAGGWNNFVSSSIGSFIGAGTQNCIAGGYQGNAFSSNHTIAGGYRNKICYPAHFQSFIGGGNCNEICCDYSVIVGGRQNCTTGGYSSVIGGGCLNTVNSEYSGILGGNQNVVNGNTSVVVGGILNCAVNNCSFIGGGYCNCASGTHSFIGSGQQNKNTTPWGVLVGGQTNCINSTTGYEIIVGGQSNTLDGDSEHSSIVGGQSNCVNDSSQTFIGNGNFNFIENGSGTVIAGGSYNSACGQPGEAFIGGGCRNLTQAIGSVIVGGYCNTGSGACGFIGGGYGNYVSAGLSSVVGGTNNEITVSSCAFIGGGRNNCINGSGGSTFLGGGEYNCIVSSTNLGHIIVGGSYNVSSNSCTGGGHTIVVGGCKNCTTGNHSAIVGGVQNTGSGDCVFIGGGYGNTACMPNSFIGGGELNTINDLSGIGCGDTIAGGVCNTTCGYKFNTIGGGCANLVKNYYSGTFNYMQSHTIGGGCQNTIGPGGGTEYGSTIGGGVCNCLCGYGSAGFIGGGQCNTLNGAQSVIAGGFSNYINTVNQAFIGGGTTNTIGNNATYSVIVGGRLNNVGSVLCGGILGGGENCVCHANSFIVGSCLTTSFTCYTFMNNACIAGTTRTTTLVETSARRFKECILPLEDQIENIKKLEPVEFQWKKDKTKDIGFIAEDVKEIFPNLVAYEEDGEISGVQYSKLTTVLVKALQQQQEQIEELKKEIFILKQQG